MNEGNPPRTPSSREENHGVDVKFRIPIANGRRPVSDLHERSLRNREGLLAVAHDYSRSSQFWPTRSFPKL